MFSLSSLLIVLFPLVIMYSTIEHPYFQSKIAPLISVDIGFQHYAEFRYHRSSNCSTILFLINSIELNYSFVCNFADFEFIENSSLEFWRVAFLCMPLNTLVNFLYPVVGVYWLRRFSKVPILYFLYESTTQLLLYYLLWRHFPGWLSSMAHCNSPACCNRQLPRRFSTSGPLCHSSPAHHLSDS